MSHNNKKDGGAEIPAIVTNSTEATETSTETPRRSRTFSPMDASPDCIRFRTPENQTIEISYESLGLTPTKMRPIRDVLTEMEDDEAWEISTKNQDLSFRLIVFLYGKGYYSDLSRQERISCIQKCITRVGGNRTRLRGIAFSHQSHRVLAHARGFDSYFYMASTARMFFEQRNATGGFPVEAYYRVQRSSNCYIVAVCMWLTVKLQRDHPAGPNQLPIDVGYIGRRYVIDTREGLERRVIEDRGDNAMTLCEKIIGSYEEWVRVNCDFQNCMDDQGYQDLQRTNLDNCMDRDVLGLLTGFCVCANFWEKSKHWVQAYGYWKFDGNSIDCEGEFVTMDADDRVLTERARLGEMWDEQLERMKTAMQSNKNKMKEVLDMSPRSADDIDDEKDDDDDSSGTSSTESESDSEGKHAMVMLGCFTEEVAGEEKRFYMLWNWWACMPLVLVSFEYLVACRCKIFFLSPKLAADVITTAQRSEALASECSFADHAENTSFREWEASDY